MLQKQYFLHHFCVLILVLSSSAHKMVYPGYIPGKGRNVHYIGGCCETIPEAWLRLTDNTMRKITIMIQDWDKYRNGNYTFDIRSVYPHQGKFSTHYYESFVKIIQQYVKQKMICLSNNNILSQTCVLMS